MSEHDEKIPAGRVGIRVILTIFVLCLTAGGWELSPNLPTRDDPINKSMLKFLRKIRVWWRDLFRKRRFNMLNATDNSEEWHIHLSPASIFAGLTAFCLLLFLLILTLIAYTPVLEFLPGYRTEADRMRENIVQNLIRLDSMERMMNDMQTYNENIALVMEGRMPVVRSFINSDSVRTNNVLVFPSREDSLLRMSMEGTGPYSLTSGQMSGSRRDVREAMALVTPVEGIVAEHFDIGQNRFGVRVAAAPGGLITAIDNGTVLQSLWTPENRYIIVVQHAHDLVSVYKNLSQSLVSRGQTIHSGDQLGYNIDPEAENSEETELFEFELWSNGKPVDPEGYIVF